MSTLRGKRVLLGVAGGIAAYKIPFLVRQLRKSEANVRVVVTHSAKEFVSPLVLATLSENPVEMDFVTNVSGKLSWNNHVKLAEWADIILVAPATSNTIGKYVNGICDNLLLATLLSSKSPIFWAPAMDLDMFENQANQGNLNLLNSWGQTVLPSPFGDLASGLVGPGRMAEPDNMYFAIRSYLLKDEFWYQKKVVLTSGPTREAIDPVRFLSNNSSGQTGVALIKALVDRGAIVTWVHGPSHYHLAGMENVTYKPVLTALEMRDQVMSIWSESDIYIGAAAVSDYRPKNSFKQKMKKRDMGLDSIKYELNPDILAEVGENKMEGQYVLGFALETINGEEEAFRKLKLKKADAIVLNYANQKKAGMNSETNIISLVSKDGNENWPLLSKELMAVELLNWIKKHSKI